MHCHSVPLAPLPLPQVWLNTGGVQGECPLAQTPAVLETAGIPYIGHTPLNAALLDDKGMFKLACAGLGLQTAPFVVHNPAVGSFRPDRSAIFKRTFGSYTGPFIVKPVNGEGAVVSWKESPIRGLVVNRTRQSGTTHCGTVIAET